VAFYGPQCLMVESPSALLIAPSSGIVRRVGKPAVYCVIVGLTFRKNPICTIYEYDDRRGDPHKSVVKRINGFLFEGSQYSVPARSKLPSGRLRIRKAEAKTNSISIKLRRKIQ